MWVICWKIKCWYLIFKHVSLLNAFISLVLITRSGLTWQVIKEWAKYCTKNFTIMCPIKSRTKPAFGIFHILAMPFCNIFNEWPSYEHFYCRHRYTVQFRCVGQLSAWHNILLFDILYRLQVGGMISLRLNYRGTVSHRGGKNAIYTHVNSDTQRMTRLKSTKTKSTYFCQGKFSKKCPILHCCRFFFKNCLGLLWFNPYYNLITMIYLYIAGFTIYSEFWYWLTQWRHQL